MRSVTMLIWSQWQQTRLFAYLTMFAILSMVMLQPLRAVADWLTLYTVGDVLDFGGLQMATLGMSAASIFLLGLRLLLLNEQSLGITPGFPATLRTLPVRTSVLIAVQVGYGAALLSAFCLLMTLCLRTWQRNGSDAVFTLDIFSSLPYVLMWFLIGYAFVWTLTAIHNIGAVVGSVMVLILMATEILPMPSVYVAMSAAMATVAAGAYLGRRGVLPLRELRPSFGRGRVARFRNAIAARTWFEYQRDKSLFYGIAVLTVIVETIFYAIMDYRIGYPAGTYLTVNWLAPLCVEMLFVTICIFAAFKLRGEMAVMRGVRPSDSVLLPQEVGRTALAMYIARARLLAIPFVLVLLLVVCQYVMNGWYMHRSPEYSLYFATLSHIGFSKEFIEDSHIAIGIGAILFNGIILFSIAWGLTFVGGIALLLIGVFYTISTMLHFAEPNAAYAIACLLVALPALQFHFLQSSKPTRRELSTAGIGIVGVAALLVGYVTFADKNFQSWNPGAFAAAVVVVTALILPFTHVPFMITRRVED